MEEVYLIKVDSTANNNKFYHMTKDRNNQTFTAEYGRVGASSVKKVYPIYDWDTKFYEKIRKGYVNNTSFFRTEDTKETKNSKCSELIKKLLMYSKKQFNDNYLIDIKNITKYQTDEVQNLINHLVEFKTSKLCDVIYYFNNYLEKIFSIIPRRMSVVKRYLANSVDDFDRLINREQEFLDNIVSRMPKTVVTDIDDDEADETDETYGVKVESINDDDKDKIMSLLGDQKYRYKNAWKITNPNTEKRFKDYQQKIGSSSSKLLFHGSRNENWLSILEKGLLIRPSNVYYTGNMFGYGIYFAPDADKSIGYTSIYGSRWANGNQNTAYLAVFECSYVNPLNINEHHYWCYDLNYNTIKKYGNYDCLHAHKGTSLRKDEIIFYSSEQLTIRYLIEIG